MPILRIIYLAVGASDALHAQTTYAALSALAHGITQQQIHIHTDMPENYQWLCGLAPHAITTKHIEKVAPGQVFRAKLSLIRQCADHFLADATLFCDADTFFIRPFGDLLAILSAGNFALHRQEYDLNTHPTPQARKFRKTLRRAGIANFTSWTTMWNSGVVGLPPGQASALDQALAMFNKLSPHTIKQYLAEQFSISCALARQSPITPAEPWLFHYWYQKADYSREIKQRLACWHGRTLEEIKQELRRERLVLKPPPMKLHWWEKLMIHTRMREEPSEIRGLPQ